MELRKPTKHKTGTHTAVTLVDEHLQAVLETFFLRLICIEFGYKSATSATDEQIPQVARLLDLPLTAVKVGRTAALVIHSKYFQVGACALTAVALCFVSSACVSIWADIALILLACVPVYYAYQAWTGRSMLADLKTLF